MLRTKWPCTWQLASSIELLHLHALSNGLFPGQIQNHQHQHLVQPIFRIGNTILEKFTKQWRHVNQKPNFLTSQPCQQSWKHPHPHSNQQEWDQKSEHATLCVQNHMHTHQLHMSDRVSTHFVSSNNISQMPRLEFKPMWEIFSHLKITSSSMWFSAIYLTTISSNYST